MARNTERVLNVQFWLWAALAIWAVGLATFFAGNIGESLRKQACTASLEAERPMPCP